MELDLTGIHKLAAEQGIDPETLDDALAEALRLAYLKTPHAAKHARVELDERSGNFTVWAADEIPVEPTEDNPYPAPKLGEEYDDTPRDFGRLAAAPAGSSAFERLPYGERGKNANAVPPSSWERSSSAFHPPAVDRCDPIYSSIIPNSSCSTPLSK